jgi:hypothetical protein
MGNVWYDVLIAIQSKLGSKSKMGVLVPPTTFRKWQAVINNSKCVQRVKELRHMASKMLPPPTESIAETYVATLTDMHQIDILTNFLLDVNQSDPLECDSVAVVKIDGPMETA